MSTQPVDAVVVEETPVLPRTVTSDRGGDLVRHRSAGSTALVAGATAGERLRVATEIATQLDDVVKRQGLRTKIGRRKVVKPDGTEVWEDAFHIDIAGWQTLAAFLELAVVPVWTRRVIDPATGEAERVTYTVRREVFAKGTRKAAIKDGTAIVERVETADVDGYSWEARVEVYKDGALVSAGEAMCSRTEETWRDRDDHSLQSMSQTRAASKAIAGVARWIVTLAGYTGTPQEEMPAMDEDGAARAPDVGPDASDDLKRVCSAATAYVLDGDVAAVDDTLARLSHQFDGRFPTAAGQAIVLLAGAIKRHHEAADLAAATATREPEATEGTGA